MAKKKSSAQLTEDQILHQAMSRLQAEGGAAAAAPLIAPEVPEPRIENEVRQSAPQRRQRPQPVDDDEPEARRPEPLKPGVHTVTYKPLEDGDPFRTVFFGMRFEANIPRETSNLELLKIAQGNPWFSVDGKPPVKRAKPMRREEDPDGLYPGMTVEDAEKHEFDPFEHGGNLPEQEVEEID